MTGRFSRRQFLASTATLPVLAAPSTARGRGGTTTDFGRRADRRERRSPGEPRGFARSWSRTYLAADTTDVEDVTARVDGEGAVAVGTTSTGDSYTETVWIAAFDADGVVWETTIESAGDANFTRVVARDDRYVVFWWGVMPGGSGEENTVATTVDAAGNTLESTELSELYGWVNDIIVEDDEYVVLGPSTITRLESDLSIAAELWTREPEGYGSGGDPVAVVPLGDGYALLGHARNADAERAFWAMKFDDADGSVEWTKTYQLSKDVSAYGAAAVTEDRAAIVGDYDRSEGRMAAIAVDADGSLAWQNVIEDRSDAQFSDAVSVDEGVRAFGWLQYDTPTVATFGPDGSLVSRWEDDRVTGARKPTAVHALGEDRYYVGGKTDGDAGGEDVSHAAWLTRLQPNDPPTPRVEVSPSEPNATEPVTFDASATTDPDTRVFDYQWNLDDDSYPEKTGETMETTFSAPGTNEVTLRAVDAYGAVGSKTVSVSVGENSAPSASVSVSPTEALPGDEVAFEATNVSDAETSVASVEWDVDGDGDVDATGTTTTTTFSSPGEHEVSATLADTAGKTTTVSTTVTVVEPTATRTQTTTEAATTDGSTAGSNGGGGGVDADGSGSIPGFGVAVTAVSVTAGALASRLRSE
jgi:plastocyanin